MTSNLAHPVSVIQNLSTQMMQKISKTTSPKGITLCTSVSSSKKGDIELSRN